MKKNLFIMCLFLSCILCVNAEAWQDTFAENVLNGAAQEAKRAEPVYKSMQTCTPASIDWLEVYGIESNKCHWKYVSYDCYTPMNVTTEYAQNALGSLKKIYSGTLSANTREAQYTQSILNNTLYCKQK